MACNCSKPCKKGICCSKCEERKDCVHACPTCVTPTSPSEKKLLKDSSK